jgi:hypothetical protein
MLKAKMLIIALNGYTLSRDNPSIIGIVCFSNVSLGQLIQEKLGFACIINIDEIQINLGAR